MARFELYCDYHAPTVRFARLDGAWFIVPARSDGWAHKRAWSPASPAVERRLATDANRVALHNAALARMCYGIPSDVYALSLEIAP